MNIFGVEHISKEIKIFIDIKNIKTNIYKMQANDLIICGYFFYLSLLDYTNLFSPTEYEKNYKIILKSFQ